MSRKKFISRRAKMSLYRRVGGHTFIQNGQYADGYLLYKKNCREAL